MPATDIDRLGIDTLRTFFMSSARAGDRRLDRNGPGGAPAGGRWPATAGPVSSPLREENLRRSAPYPKLQRKLGFKPEAVATAALELVGREKGKP